MTIQTTGLLWKRALRQFTPDIFLHPVWVRFACTDSTPLPEGAEILLHAANTMREGGNIDGACDLLFLVTAAHIRLGDYPAALSSMQKMLKLAKRHHLTYSLICGYWGAAAICLRQGALHRGAAYLWDLYAAILTGGDWVLADLVEMIARSLDRLAGASLEPLPPEALLAGCADPALRAALEALLNWGDIPPGTRPEFPASRVPRPAAGLRRWRALLQKKFHWLIDKTPAAWAEPLAPAAVPLAEPPAAIQKAESAPRASAPPFASPPSQVLPSEAPPPYQAPPARGAEELQVYFLGAFRIYEGETLLADWPSLKSLSIFKYLAANRGKPIPKDILMDQFWAETDAEVARRNLHQAIYALRQALKRGRPDFAYILFENDCYRLNPALEIWLDFEVFEQKVLAGRRLQEAGRMREAAAEYGIAETLYQGDFLEEDLYEEWPNSLRGYYRGLYLDTLERLSLYFYQQKQYYAAIILCQKTLAKDNCSEQAYRCLIRCYLAQGQRQQAAREYQACLLALKRELNLAPSEETRAVYPLIFGSKG